MLQLDSVAGGSEQVRGAVPAVSICLSTIHCESVGPQLGTGNGEVREVVTPFFLELLPCGQGLSLPPIVSLHSCLVCPWYPASLRKSASHVGRQDVLRGLKDTASPVDRQFGGAGAVNSSVGSF